MRRSAKFKKKKKISSISVKNVLKDDNKSKITSSPPHKKQNQNQNEEKNEKKK
jgi:hypothetical protein